jgi:hypothetical protein
MEAARPEECRTFNNRYSLVLANHNILILNKREQKIEGLEVDPNPSSFLPLYLCLSQFHKLYIYHLRYHLYLSKLPPTSDNLDVQVR